MSAKLGSRAALVTALMLVLVGAPAAADDTTSSTATASTTTASTTAIDATTTVESSTTIDTAIGPGTSTAGEPSGTTESSGPATTSSATPTTTDPTTTDPTTTVATTIVASTIAAAWPPLVLNSGASAAPAVPITGPAAASVTPERGSQVQLQPPPPPPPAEWELPANSGSGRRAVYSKSLQRVWAVDETGTVIKTHRVSGRLDPNDPAPGVYSVYSRSIHTFAIHNPSITWDYMVRFAHGSNGGNIGFHAIPYQYGHPVQTVDQLGEALSGGCVRQAPEDAIWMWNWAQVGTVVVVLA